MKNSQYLVLFFFLFIVGCKKEMDLPDPSLRNIFGKWEWISSETNGVAGSFITTPASVGFSQSMEFEKNGVFKRYVNRDKEDRGRYVIELKSSIFGGEGYLIRFRNAKHSPLTYGLSRVYFFGNDTLKLSEECYDCSSHLFVRK